MKKKLLIFIFISGFSSNTFLAEKEQNKIKCSKTENKLPNGKYHSRHEDKKRTQERKDSRDIKEFNQGNLNLNRKIEAACLFVAKKD